VDGAEAGTTWSLPDRSSDRIRRNPGLRKGRERPGHPPLGIGLGVAGVSGTVYVCVQSAGLGCVLAVEAAPAYVVGGYYLTRSGVNELEEIFVKDCE
jgi:hypothetical protein